MFTIMAVRVAGTSARSTSVVLNSRMPSYTDPCSPSAQHSVIGCLSLISSVPCKVPTMAGSPSSRLTMAAWLVVPP